MKWLFKPLFYFLLSMFFNTEILAQYTNAQLLQKFKDEFDETEYATFCYTHNIGTFDEDDAEVDSLVDGINVAKFVKIPVYKSRNVNAAILGFLQPSSDMFVFNIVEIVVNVDTVTVNFYKASYGREASLKFEEDTLVNVVRIDPNSCVADMYEDCQEKCQKKRKCRVSCAFWNDWFGNSCNKAMWAGAVACCGLNMCNWMCGGML